MKATEEACKRQALDDFMHEIRVEERSYVRETKSLQCFEEDHGDAGADFLPQHSAFELD